MVPAHLAFHLDAFGLGWGRHECDVRGRAGCGAVEFGLEVSGEKDSVVVVFVGEIAGQALQHDGIGVGGCRSVGDGIKSGWDVDCCCAVGDGGRGACGQVGEGEILAWVTDWIGGRGGIGYDRAVALEGVIAEEGVVSVDGCCWLRKPARGAAL